MQPFKTLTLGGLEDVQEVALLDKSLRCDFIHLRYLARWTSIMSSRASSNYGCRCTRFELRGIQG